MPVKERTPKERRHQLNHEEEQELWLGPTRRGSVFESAAQAGDQQVICSRRSATAGVVALRIIARLAWP